LEDRWAASEASGATSLLDIFAEGTTERQDVLRRLGPALVFGLRAHQLRVRLASHFLGNSYRYICSNTLSILFLREATRCTKCPLPTLYRRYQTSNPSADDLVFERLPN
jgi:hypothetical protein